MLQRLDKETLIRYLLVGALFLVGVAGFILFFDTGLPVLERVIRYLGVLLSPFAVAWLAAAVTRPATKWLSKTLRFPRSLSVLLMELLLLAVITALAMLMLSVISGLLGDLSHYLANMEHYVGDIGVWVNGLFDRLGTDYSTIDYYLDQWKDKVASLASQGMGLALGVLKGTPGAIVWFFVVLVAVFYWCRDEEKVSQVLANAFPAQMQANVYRTYDDISTVIGGYIRAWALLVLISTTLCTVGFALIGVESALAMGLFAGIMDIIPVLGPGTLIVPWAVWSLATGKIGFGVGLLIIYAVVSATRYILEPKVVGDRVGLHPLAAIAAIFIGMKLFGVVGLILGPIVLAVIMTMYRARRQSRIMKPDKLILQNTPAKGKNPGKTE